MLLREAAAAVLNEAALLRDQIKELKRQFGQASGPAKALAVSYPKGRKRGVR